MEKDDKKTHNEKEDSFTRTTTPSFSRRLETIHENMEKIPEQNESFSEEQKSIKASKNIDYEAYNSRKPSLFNASLFTKKDSESIIKDMERNLCCIKKEKKGNSDTQTVCKLDCNIF